MGKKLLNGKELIDRAKELGVSEHDLNRESGPNEAELQRRVIEAERANREENMWKVAAVAGGVSVISAIAAALSAGAAWWAVLKLG